VPTNLAGEYRMWVRPGTYNVRARGQTGTPNVVTFSTNNNPPDVNFTAAMGRATTVVSGPGGPLGQIKVQVFDTSNNFLGHETTNSDGSVVVYALPTGASYRIQYLLDNGSTVAGSVVDTGTATPTQTVLGLGTPIVFGAATVDTPIQLGGGTITLPAGGELKGIIKLGTAPIGNVIVQVRFSGSRTVNTRTSQDGSYSVSLPGATYSRVCAFVLGSVSPCPFTPVNTPFQANQWGSANNVLVTNGQSVSADIAIPTQ